MTPSGTKLLSIQGASFQSGVSLTDLCYYISCGACQKCMSLSLKPLRLRTPKYIPRYLWVLRIFWNKALFLHPNVRSYQVRNLSWNIIKRLEPLIQGSGNFQFLDWVVAAQMFKPFMCLFLSGGYVSPTQR